MSEDLVISAPNTETSTGAGDLFTAVHPTTFWIGIGLTISSSIFIGASFIIKKVALLRLSKSGTRAGHGGYGYLKDFLWWAGLLTMGIGEAANFVAYAFAPASVVSTLGVLSVLVSTVLSSKFLNEKLNILGKIGCFLCAVGSTIIVVHAPNEQRIKDIEDLESKIFDPTFVTFVVIVIAGSLILIYHFRKKYLITSTKTLLIWIGVCSMIGSLSVMFCKGVGLAVTVSFQGRNEFKNWLTWVCIVALILCVAVQMNFLNKALDTFSTAIVTPIYYVFFTTCVIIASAILFREFSNLPPEDWIGMSCGFATVLSAIFLLHFCKNYDITLANLTHQIILQQEEAPGAFIKVPVSDPSDESEGEEHKTAEVEGHGCYGALGTSDNYA